ncbi:MAG: PAS domain S-box protein [Methanomicrobiaceae archaeon]|nr:PAS domain S-box protein [Methanomicrobiaceae archaeon]
MDDSDKKLRHLNKILKSIRDINQLIVHEKNLTSLIEKACGILVRDQGYFSAWIALFPDEKGSYIFAEKGLGKDFDELKTSIISEKLSNCAKKAIKTGEVVLIKDPSSECRDCVLSGNYKGRSAMTAAISYNKKNYGIITVSTSAIFESVEEEIDLFTEMAGDLGYAISSIEKERERLQAFALIEENEKKYQKLFDSANDMIYLHETKPDGLPGKILEVNETACRKMGYTREEFLKKSVLDLNDPDFEGDLLKVIDKLKEKKNVVFEWSHITKNGDKIPVEISVHNFVLEGENVALAVVRDISERKNLEKELILTLNATTDGIWKWNFATDKMEFSSRYYTMLGYEPDEFPANYESWLSLIHPEDMNKAIKTAEKYLETRPDNYENEFRLKTKDGGYKWIHASARVVERDNKGNAIRMIGNHTDITETKKQEIKLKLTGFSVENSPISIFWIRPDGSFYYVNKAACSELGYTEEEILKLNVSDLDPNYPIYERESLWRRLKYEKVLQMETLHKTKDGISVPVLVNTYYLSYMGDEFEIANAIDITERKLAEEEILKSETKFRELFNNVSESVFLHEPIDAKNRGNIIEVNDTACRRLGYTREELLRMTVADVNTPEVSKNDRKRVETVMKNGTFSFEGEHVRKDGSVFPVAVNARLIEIGEKKYILSLVRDISEEKETLRREAEALMQIEKNLLQMAALNDRIRNPLSVIAGYLSLEEDRNTSGLLLQQVKEIDDIITELDRGWLESQKIREFLRRHYGVD